MTRLRELLDLLPDERVQTLLAAEGTITLPDAARPYFLASLASHIERPVLAIAARQEEADQLAHDIHAYLGRSGAETFPGWEVLPGEPISPSVDAMGRRLHALARLQRGETFVLVTTAQGATQLVAPQPALDVISLAQGGNLDLDETAERLVAMGYERNYIVERRGEFAIRGGILDVFPPHEERPLRIELWGDEISSIRQFALASQRSLQEVDGCAIAPCRELRADDATMQRAAELAARDDDPALAQLAEGIIEPGAERLLPLLHGAPVPLASLLGDGAPVVILEPKRVRDRSAEVLEQVEEWAKSSGFTDRHYAPLDEGFVGRDVLLVSSFAEPGAESFAVDTWTSLAGKPEELVGRLRGLAREGYRVVVAVSTGETAQRIARRLEEAGVQGAEVVTEELSRGILLGPPARLALVAEADITGRRASSARRRSAARRAEASGPLDLAVGDLVVHDVHGIGRYLGMVDRNLLGVHREYLILEYAKGDKLYVPSDQVDLVGKYIGGEAPKISRLGSNQWAKTKARVGRKAREIAAELVQLYAKRLRAKGHSFPPDTPWQRELEEAFPYEETPDQLRAIDEVKDDMESPTPMDRLVCGDVGFGKTEIAVRAAFKAVNAGKQVVVLVPTTILAQQHHSTFKERFRAFPVRVEMLSRFLSASEARKVVADLAAGKIDVVVGTHRLLSQDVSFADLGLVIVDEEQRFGVEQKERLKALRTSVDVLTLTATPIPRTLEMAMSGIRDMSIIETPPEDRHPVMTYVGEYADDLIVSGIRRELLRDGQVFYVHHRVDTINRAARRIADLVPDARVAVAHGQMDERQLEQTMLDFGDAKTNVLVCTTIIESGLDMPTVNTLMVERADLLGLAQMYQLRGRVGRAHERAYAYLFFPPERALTEGAHERLKTIAEHSGLGSGFRIAMRDLEIRGAGNLLGGEQHGHIEEIGFDLYVKMMAQAVEEARGEAALGAPDQEVRIDLPLDAFIPKDYVADENLRLEAYRSIAAARTEEELAEVQSALQDRYGSPIPAPVDGLFEVARLRSLMVANGIQEAATVARHLRIRPIELAESRQVRLQRILPAAEWKPETASLLIPARLLPKEGVVAWVTDLLQQLTSAP